MCSQEKSLPGSFLWCLISVVRVAAYFCKEIKFEKDTKFCWPGLYSGVSCCGQAGQALLLLLLLSHDSSLGATRRHWDRGQQHLQHQQTTAAHQGVGFELQKVGFRFLNGGILLTDWEILCVLNTTRDVNWVPIILSGSIYVSLDTFEHEQSSHFSRVGKLKISVFKW